MNGSSTSGPPPRAYAVCGFKESGKTTLLVELVRELRARGLSVGVLKTDAHGLRLDGEGTDSDRLSRAGADVTVRGPTESLRRRAETEGEGREGLEETAAGLAAQHDLVLVEGGKGSSLPKIWLGREGDPGPPPEVTAVERFLPWGAPRLEAASEAVAGWLERDWTAGPVAGGVLAGGESRRMGSPKEELEVGGRTLLRRTGEILAAAGLEPVVRLGGSGGAWPSIPDPPGLVGPLAGIAAASRWLPERPWLIAACDLPRLEATAVEWLLAHRRPGVWAVIPLAEGARQPLLATYEPMIRPRIEALARSFPPAPSRLAGEARVLEPVVPPELAEAFRGANTPVEWRRLRGG